MKKNLLIVAVLLSASVHAQNIFPASGRTGIYTTTPAASLQVKGGARIGTLANYMAVDSATGNLSFVGTAGYRVANNTFAFSAAGAPLAGLYFNATNLRYEFRNTTGTSVFNVAADANGNVGIGTTPTSNKLDVNGAIRSATTVDAVSSFLSNGQRALLSSSNTTFNTFVGFTPAQNVSTYNTAVGYNALGSGSTGTSNTAMGVQSLLSNTSGSQNAGYGYGALQNTTTGSQNTAFGGRNAGNVNTSGNYNTFVGAEANASVGNLSNATAIGANAIVSASNSMQLGDANVTNVKTSGTVTAGTVTYPNAHGTSGQVLTTSGSGALTWSTPTPSQWLSSGNDIYNSNIGNVGIGTSTPAAKLDIAGDAIINGVPIGLGQSPGAANLLFGLNALASNTSGHNNNAFAFQALYSNTTGEHNVGIGQSSLFSNTTGNYNLAFQSGLANTTGSYNSYLGYLSNCSVGNLNNATAVGANAIVTASNSVQLGDANVTNVNTSGTLTAGAVTYPNIDGTIGQVLGTSGTGTLQWVTPGATPWSVSGNNVYNSNTGNIGVGTSTPSSKLDVNGSANFSGLVKTSGTAPIGQHGSSLWIGGNDNGALFSTGTNELGIRIFNNSISPGSSTIQGWDYFQNVPRVIAINDGGGNVGIGTSAPVAKLDVTGNVKIADGTQGSGKVLTSDANGLASWTTPGATPWSVSGSNIYNNNSGKVGIGTNTPTTQLQVNNGDGTSNTIFTLSNTFSSFSNVAQIAMKNSSSTDRALQFWNQNSSASSTTKAYEFLNNTASGPLLTILNGGNVGLGISAPTSRLDVAGNAAITTAVANNYVMTISNTNNVNTVQNQGLRINAGSNAPTTNQVEIGFYRPDGTNVGSVQMANASSVAYNTTSDERLKENIRDSKFGINDLMKIKISDYNYKDDKVHPQTGYIAQQLYNIFPFAVSKGGDDPKTQPWMVDYGRMTPLIVKSVQDQQKELEAKDAKISDLEASVNKLQNQMNTILQKLSDLQNAQQACCNASAVTANAGNQDVTLSRGDAALLQQNAPNPFSNTTVIRYYLPASINTAQVLITDNKGVAIKTIVLSQKGNGQVTLAAGSLASGTYFYSLLVDGNKIDTKQMQIMK